MMRLLTATVGHPASRHLRGWLLVLCALAGLNLPSPASYAPTEARLPSVPLGEDDEASSLEATVLAQGLHAQRGPGRRRHVARPAPLTAAHVPTSSSALHRSEPLPPPDHFHNGLGVPRRC